jgi:hypothetical protein
VKPLFPAWSNSIFRIAIGAVAVFFLIGVPTFLMLWARTPYSTGELDPRTQPIKFDHRHHVRDDGIDCKYCHNGVATSAYAGVPPTSLCMNCHSQVWTASPELTLLRESYFSNTPIVWERVNSVPDYVFFNHSIHVTKGVGCVTCHGRVDLMGQVYQAEPLSMGFCLNCHRAPERYLRPPDKVTDMEWAPDGSALEVGLAIKKKYAVDPTTDCTGCHR